MEADILRFSVMFFSIDSLPSITSVKFKDHLSMAVGTSTGQVCSSILFLVFSLYLVFMRESRNSYSAS